MRGKRATLVGRGGDQYGAGHWTRLLALSRALTEDGYRCTLVTDQPNHPAVRYSPIPVQRSVPRSSPVIIQDPPLSARGGDLVVAVVDGDATLFHADLVVYQHAGDPAIKTRGRVLAGPAYACLRPAFALAHAACEPTVRPIQRVLVACGASRMGRDQAFGIAGYLALHNYEPVFLEQAGYYGDVVGVMRTCDAAVTTPSMGALEALCLGLPVLTAVLNPEQEQLAAALHHAGLAMPYDTRLAWSWDHALTGWQAVDGHGIYRVAAAIARSRSARARSSSD